MKHIFMGSIDEEGYYIDYLLDYGNLDDPKPFIRTCSSSIEWEQIQENNNISFPLRKHDPVKIDNEDLFILEARVNDDGSIICKTSKILKVVKDNEELKKCENIVAEYYERKNKERQQKELENVGKSWFKRLFE